MENLQRNKNSEKKGREGGGEVLSLILNLQKSKLVW